MANKQQLYGKHMMCPQKDLTRCISASPVQGPPSFVWLLDFFLFDEALIFEMDPYVFHAFACRIELDRIPKYNILIRIQFAGHTFLSTKA